MTPDYRDEWKTMSRADLLRLRERLQVRCDLQQEALTLIQLQIAAEEEGPMPIRIGKHIDTIQNGREEAKKAFAAITGIPYVPPPAEHIPAHIAAKLAAVEAMEKANPESPESRALWVKGLANQVTSDALRRDVQSREQFLRTHPITECHASPALTLKFYLRTAAMLFTAGFNQRGKSMLDMAHDARMAIMTARVALAIEESAVATPTTQANKDENTNLVLDTWLGCWFRGGCPHVILKREEAAALALTDMPEAFTAANEIPAPWPHFLISLPSDVLVIQDGDDVLSVDRIIMHRVSSDAVERGGPEFPGFWFTFIGAGGELIQSPNLSLQAVAALEEQGQGTGAESFRRTSGGAFTPAIKRGLGAAARIAAGVCFALENKRVEGRLKVRHSPPSRVGGLPQTTDYRLGLPIKIDFTEPLREYTLGRAKTMHKVQWVVRGHWRNQAVGKGRNEHRRIWIQPFWKGSAAMPILVRGHVLGVRGDAPKP